MQIKFGKAPAEPFWCQYVLLMPLLLYLKSGLPFSLTNLHSCNGFSVLSGHNPQCVQSNLQSK